MLRFAPHRSRGSRPAAAPRPLVCARWGAAAPRASPRSLRSRCSAPSPMGAAPRVPGHKAPPVPPCSSASLRRIKRLCGPARGPLRPSLGLSAVPRAFCALRVLPGRFAALARFGAARPPPGVAALPPAPPLGRLCAASRLRGLSLAPAAFGPGLASLRAPCSVALAALGLGPCAARGPAGVSLAPLRASLPAAPARPPLRPVGRFPPPGGRALAAARGPLGRLLRLWWPLWWLSALLGLRRAPWICCADSGAPLARPGALRSPLPPPRPGRPRWGLPGSALPVGWLRPPLRGSRFSRPSCGPPLPEIRPPVPLFRPG